MKTRLPNLLCLLAVPGVAMWCGGAHAGVCNATVPDACVNTFDLTGHPQAYKLISDLKFEGPIVKLRYTVELFELEAFLAVRWSEANGSTLVNGANFLGWFTNSSVSWSQEWVGLLFPHPDITLLTGKADFTDSVPKPPGCKTPCDAKYYDWIANVPARPLAPMKANVRSALAAGATPLPPGFENVTQTSSAAQSVALSATDPTNLDAATFTDEYRFSSRVENASAGWQYVYTFENLSDIPVNISLSELGFAGPVAPDATVTMNTFSNLGPGVLETTPTIERDPFTTISGRFDALVPLRAGPKPVPEPPSFALLLIGLCFLGVLSLRHHRARSG